MTSMAPLSALNSAPSISIFIKSTFWIRLFFTKSSNDMARTGSAPAKVSEDTWLPGPRSLKYKSSSDEAQTGLSITVIRLLILEFSAKFRLMIFRLAGMNSNVYTCPLPPTSLAKYRAASPQQPPASMTISPSLALITKSDRRYSYCLDSKMVCRTIGMEWIVIGYPIVDRFTGANVQPLVGSGVASVGLNSDLNVSRLFQ